MNLDLAAVTVDTFAPHVGEPFAADAGEPWTLTAAEALSAGEGAPRSPFALTFEGPPDWSQGTIGLTHAALGRIDVFVVPLAPGRYQATFG